MFLLTFLEDILEAHRLNCKALKVNTCVCWRITLYTMSVMSIVSCVTKRNISDGHFYNKTPKTIFKMIYDSLILELLCHLNSLLCMLKEWRDKSMEEKSDEECSRHE